jgi:hypothetical protein
MKLLPLLIALSLLLTGCVQRYQITLTNGNTITTRGKPKLNKETGAYMFNDTEGKPSSLPAFRIKQIEPL